LILTPAADSLIFEIFKHVPFVQQTFATMDFVEQQEQARHRTKRFILYFVVAIGSVSC